MLLESLSCTAKTELPKYFQIHACAIAEMLSWLTGATISPALSAQLHCLAEPALLKALVQQALPVQTSAPPVDSMQHASTVRSLCKMLQGITTIPALCQKALIFTAGPADFVQRLWSSYLKVNPSPPATLPVPVPLQCLCQSHSSNSSTLPAFGTHQGHEQTTTGKSTCFKH